MSDLHTTEAEMAEVIGEAIQAYASSDARSAQAARYQVGISEIGFCSERTRRMLAGEDPDDTDLTLAFLGTAIGDHAERAIKAHAWPDALIQPEVVLRLDDGVHTYDIPGHPDVVLPEGVLLDVKAPRGHTLAEAGWRTSQQKRFQRHGYAKACADAGLFDVGLDEVLVGNVFIDRAGDDKEPLVRLEPYDPDMVAAMTDWLSEVVYAYTHHTEARKEPPREVCAKFCGFFATCRAWDTDVQGLLSDELTLTAVEQYERGKALVREGDRLKDQAKAALVGTEGFAKVGEDRFVLRWIHLNEADVAFTRKASEKIDLRRLK